MRDKIFREVSLKRLSSPDQLDQLIQVTSPRGWLALTALGLLLAGAVIWGFAGSIPTKIEGRGILLNNGGVFSLTHQSGGQVLDVRFGAGDRVKKGDVIARITQTELEGKITDLLDRLQSLAEGGQSSSPEYRELAGRAEGLQAELAYRSQIVSPIEGRILEQGLQPGSMIQPGQTLVTLEEYGAAVRLEAVFYVSARQAGKIRPGMEVQISPTIINKEEYGFMLGRVTSVADYPATARSMMQTLGNENLVSLLTGQGDPLEVKADLAPDNTVVSGYKWSSRAGPPLVIHSGTLIGGTVVIAREKPAAKVIPFFSTQAGPKGENKHGAE